MFDTVVLAISMSKRSGNMTPESSKILPENHPFPVLRSKTGKGKRDVLTFHIPGILKNPPKKIVFASEKTNDQQLIVRFYLGNGYTPFKLFCICDPRISRSFYQKNERWVLMKTEHNG